VTVGGSRYNGGNPRNALPWEPAIADCLHLGRPQDQTASETSPCLALKIQNPKSKIQNPMMKAEAENRWLGIDPGLALVGWAILDEDSRSNPLLVDYGTIATDPSHPTPQRLVELEQDLMALFAEFQPTRVAVEMPFFSRQIKAAGGVLQAVGIINLVCCRDGGILPVFLHQSSWKAHLGNGRADKAEVAALIQTLFDLEQLPVDDSVDAIGIGYAGLCGLTNNIE
jgi:crossover junction endodeoxyribonuclease RuvC